jgi:hypothetical protein
MGGRLLSKMKAVAQTEKKTKNDVRIALDCFTK